MEQLKIEVSIQILKPRNEVYEAIVDPLKMSNYFIAEGSGTMREGKTVEWKFPEFDDKFKIEVLKTRPSEFISFKWEGADGKMLTVAMDIEDHAGNTVVKITEGKMKNNEEGILWYGRNTGGWANFLDCLKAFMEYGINLRKGAFDFMKK